jgi:hypothetical protein
MMIDKDIPYTRMLKATADAFRLGMEGLASENFIKVIDLLASLVLDPALPNREGINSILGELLDAQSRKDYFHAADLLEYELPRWFVDSYGGAK